MPLHARVLVVIQTGPAQLLVFHREPQRLDQVQRATRVGRQTDHVAGVGRDFGMNENDVEHGGSGPQTERDGRGVRATTQASTRAAPACFSTRAISASVAPVVITSSTTTMRRPATALRRSGSSANAPRTLAARCCG